MLKPNFVTKYPREIIDFSIDLSSTIPEGGAISSVSLLVLDIEGNNVTTRIVDRFSFSDDVLNVLIKDGSANQRYTLWIMVEYNDGQRIFYDLTIKVLQGP
jgi:hypothetical protein